MVDLNAHEAGNGGKKPREAYSSPSLLYSENAALSPVFTPPPRWTNRLALPPGALGSNGLDRPGDSKILHVELLRIWLAPFSALAPSDHK